MAQVRSEKAPLFYQLTHKEWQETVKNLTGAEIKVLYYIRSLDPFGDRNLEYSVTQMAGELGLSKGAVSKALKKLEQMGLIDVELVRVKIQIKSNNYKVTEFPERNDVSYRKQEFTGGNDGCPEETEVTYKKQWLHRRNNQQLEPLPDKDFSTLQTNKTYTDFIQTLSDNEREKFWEFGLLKTKNLPKEPVLPERWVEANWQELYTQFKSTTEAAAACVADTDATPELGKLASSNARGSASICCTRSVLR